MARLLRIQFVGAIYPVRARGAAAWAFVRHAGLMDRAAGFSALNPATAIGTAEYAKHAENQEL